MKFGSKRNDRQRRPLIVERLEIRALLSASRFSFAFDHGFDASPRDRGERFGDRDAGKDFEVRGSYDSRHGHSDDSKRSKRGDESFGKQSHGERLSNERSSDDELFGGSSIDVSSETGSKVSELSYRSVSSAILASGTGADVPAQIRDSGRGVSLGSDSLAYDTEHVSSWGDSPRMRFNNGFERADRLDQALGSGIIKAAVERRLPTVSDAGTPDELTAGDPSSGDPSSHEIGTQGLASVRYVSTVSDSTFNHSPSTVFEVSTSRVFAPPTSFTAVALAQANDRLADTVSGNSSISDSMPLDSMSSNSMPTTSQVNDRSALDFIQAPPSNPPSVIVSSQIELSFRTRSVPDLGPATVSFPQNTTVGERVGRSARVQANVSEMALRVLAQMEAVRNEVSSMLDGAESIAGGAQSIAGGSDSEGPYDASSSFQLRDGFQATRESNAGPAGGFVELTPGASSLDRGLAEDAEVILGEQSIDRLFAGTESGDDFESSSLSATQNLGFENSFEVLGEEALQLDAIFAGDSPEFENGQRLGLSAAADASRGLSLSAVDDAGGFIELQRSLGGDKRDSDVEAMERGADQSANSSRQHTGEYFADGAQDASEINMQWIAEQEDAEFGGFVELANGTEQGDQWLAMNLESPDSATLAAYDPSYIEATAGVFRGIELVGVQATELIEDSAIDEFVSDEFLMFDEPISLGDYFGTPLRRAMVGVPAAMVLSSYLVRQRVSEDEEARTIVVQPPFKRQ